MELIDNIKKYFSSLIEKYDLSVSPITSNNVRLENNHCIVDLQLERGVEFYVTFIDKKTKHEYALMNLIFFRGLQKSEKINATGLFDLHAKEIELYFSNLLLGDFSWSEKYDEFMKRYTS